MPGLATRARREYSGRYMKFCPFLFIESAYVRGCKIGANAMKEIWELMNDFYLGFLDLTEKHETLMGTIIGAFLAALFGILTQMYINRIEQRKQLKKNCNLIYHDIQKNINDLKTIKSLMEISKKKGEFEKIKFFEYAKKNKYFDYYSQWRECLLHIGDKLPDEYFVKIMELYGSIEQIKETLISDSLEKFYKLLNFAFWEDDIKESLGFNLVSSRDLLFVLKSLRKHGKIRWKRLNDSIETLFFVYLVLKFSIKIEAEVFKWLQTQNRIETDNLIERVDHWLRKQKKFKYRIIYKGMIKRFVYFSLKRSKRIKFDWGECSINLETKNEVLSEKKLKKEKR